MPTRTFTATAPVDLLRSMAPQAAGHTDPSMALARDSAWVALRTETGPATVHISGSGTSFAAEAWGPGAEIALDVLEG